MTALSLRFSQALARGRRSPKIPDSRATLLVSLLRKRATAHSIGADDLEALLRDQIKWSLPMERRLVDPIAPTEEAPQPALGLDPSKDGSTE